MNKLILAIIFSLMSCFLSCTKLDKISTQIKTEEFTIIEGKGFYKYRIDSTTIKEIIQDFGRNYRKIRHKGYSIEIMYEQYGLSFYYDPSDLQEKLFSIEFFHPFKGVTSRGIALNKSTMLDVERLDGSLDWYTTENSKYWVSEYPGIEYSVDRDISLPQFPLDEELHSKKIITLIEIISNENDFE